jgi:hypothetical protein
VLISKALFVGLMVVSIATSADPRGSGSLSSDSMSLPDQQTACHHAP